MPWLFGIRETLSAGTPSGCVFSISFTSSVAVLALSRLDFPELMNAYSGQNTKNNYLKFLEKQGASQAELKLEGSGVF